MIPQAKIDGLIALMKRGIYEGERSQARRALERLCSKYGVSLDDLLNETEEVKEYEQRCKDKLEAEVFAQTCFRYAEPRHVGYSWRGSNRVVFECTPAKYMELMTAWSVLKQVWRKEQQTLMYAFFASNGLYGKPKEGQKVELSPEEELMRKRAAMMGMYMVRAEIHKQIAAPSE